VGADRRGHLAGPAEIFPSLFVWIDFQLFFPRPKAGEARIPGGSRCLVVTRSGCSLSSIFSLPTSFASRRRGRDLFLIPLLALMLVPLLIWQYTGAPWLFNTVHTLGIDLAQFGIPFFVWVVFVSTLVGFPFFALLFYLHGRRAGSS
jgi:hypothetical protein